MHNFKVGDRVRRLGQSIGGHGIHRKINTGDIVEITSISGSYLRFFNETSGWEYYGFELVPPKEPTDEELAAEYRRGISEARKARKTLLERGFVLMLGAVTVANTSSTPLEGYKFTKTVTTTKEI